MTDECAPLSVGFSCAALRLQEQNGGMACSPSTSKFSPGYRPFRKAVLLVLFVAFGQLLTATRSLDASRAGIPHSFAPAVNTFGVDLWLAEAESDRNVLIAPYSIAHSLALAAAGSEGRTRHEILKSLNLAESDPPRELLGWLRRRSYMLMTAESRFGDSRPGSPEIETPVRLFIQAGHALRQSFLAAAQLQSGSELEHLDFKGSPVLAIERVNKWVSDATGKRITELVPPGGVDATTRLVLANVMYVKAWWDDPFDPGATYQALFHLTRDRSVPVQMMRAPRARVRYDERDGVTAIGVPLRGTDLQLLVMMSERDTPYAIARTLSSERLSRYAAAPMVNVELSLPRISVFPRLRTLRSSIHRLGVRAAFDEPPGTADFNALVEGSKQQGFHLSEVYHRAFLVVDEQGLLAGAATALGGRVGGIQDAPTKRVVVDRPFLFAIQSTSSGACLMFGDVSDPRE